MSHTPSPWVVCKGYSDAFTRRVPIRVGSAPAMTIAETLGAPKGDLADANANYIVRAVNAHAALVAACERLVREAPLVRGNVTGLWSYLTRWEAECQAALALAKGE